MAPHYFYKLQPLSDIHLRSNLQYELAPTGNAKQVYIFSTIAIFILLLAGINYTNLATARSVNRAKEVGVKKVVGAGKRQLLLQYLFESVFTAILAFIFSIGSFSISATIFLSAYEQRSFVVFISYVVSFSVCCNYFLRTYFRYLSGYYSFRIQTNRNIKRSF